MVIATSPADRTEASEQAGGAVHGGFGHASLVPYCPLKSPKPGIPESRDGAQVDELCEVDGILQTV